MRYVALVCAFLLVGFMLGRWAPTSENHRLRAEVEELSRGPKRVSVGPQVAVSGARDFLRIERKAAERSRNRKQQAEAAEATLPTSPTTVTNDVDEVASTNRPPRGRRNPIRVGLGEAQDVWQVRADLAKQSFLERTRASKEDATRFDVLVEAMNLRVGHAIETWVEDVETKGRVTSEDGARLVHDLSGAVVLTYDEMDRGLSEGWREAAGEEFQVFDFIDPDVATPLIDVEDLLKEGRFRGNRMRQ